MPKETFFRLPEEKKTRILESARQEFFRVPYAEASINQIIKNAEIPRGSFYQYFEDKKDIFLYVLSLQHEKIIGDIHASIIKNKGDIFLFLYDFIDKMESHHKDENCERIRSSLINPETFCLVNGMMRGEKIFRNVEEQLNNNLLKYIDFSLYGIEDEEEKLYFVDVLGAVMQDNLRKLLQIDEKDDGKISNQYTYIRKRMAFLEKYWRKMSE